MRGAVLFVTSFVATAYLSDVAVYLTILSKIHIYSFESESDLKRLLLRQRIFTSFLQPALLLNILIWQTWRKLRPVETLPQLGGLLPISPSSAPELWSMLHSLLEDIRAEDFDLEIVVWLKRTDAEILPTVRSHGEKSDVILPRKFLVLFGRRPDHARAILAHEMAHVVHDDTTSVTAVNFLSFSLIQACGLEFVILYLGQALLSATVATLLTVAIIVPAIVSAIKASFYFHEAEFIADRFALRFADGAALIESIRLYSEDNSPFHPLKTDRINAIKHLVPTVRRD
jgi:hypothetical protein